MISFIGRIFLIKQSLCISRIHPISSATIVIPIEQKKRRLNANKKVHAPTCITRRKENPSPEQIRRLPAQNYLGHFSDRCRSEKLVFCQANRSLFPSADKPKRDHQTDLLNQLPVYSSLVLTSLGGSPCDFTGRAKTL